MDKFGDAGGADLLPPHPVSAGAHGCDLRQSLPVLATRFTERAVDVNAGLSAIQDRSVAVDETVTSAAEALSRALPAGVSVLAVGGFGRRELFPYSDVDLLFLLNGRVVERDVKEDIRAIHQRLWDAGLRVSAMTRTLAECERFDPENVEFTLSLLDARHLAGDSAGSRKLLEKSLPKLLAREAAKIAARLVSVTQTRHGRYGNTIFHLEPNIKECPGGLRDVHVCGWLGTLFAGLGKEEFGGLSAEFDLARQFLISTRVFLHLEHKRDDNTLDWQAQDAAAQLHLALGASSVSSPLDAGYWMRQYFRHARVVERAVGQRLHQASVAKPVGRLRALATLGLRQGEMAYTGFRLHAGRLEFTSLPAHPEQRSAHDPETVLTLFGVSARLQTALTAEAEHLVEQGLPYLSAQLEDGPNLWRHLRTILLGAGAGKTLRCMHAIGVLELLIPEFHGIDALVIRDAYHRYTVDEHTFVLIDTLHELRGGPTHRDRAATGLEPWAARFGVLLRDLPHPELLFLAALLHDTGKSHAGVEHALESARMAASVLERLELDSYEATLVLDVIRNHLEMSAALRRDVFDTETIRSFAARVPNPEALRMLTLFTYADVAAVHPDALTPWKAENLWRLYNATLNYLDRNVDDERVAVEAGTDLRELVHRVHGLVGGKVPLVDAFLVGLPTRYLQTRTPETIARHLEMASRLAPCERLSSRDEFQLDFRYAPGVSELTLITHDRPMLFASMAGILAAWGMNIVTADAFSNAEGTAVETFRFTDTFKTLELNETERGRFVENAHDVLAGKVDLDGMLAARRRGRSKAAKVIVETRIDLDNDASTQSTLMQVVAQDVQGLLRAVALTLAEHRCNIEVALIDTEGERAIDVFYITEDHAKLGPTSRENLHKALLEAIQANVA